QPLGTKRDELVRRQTAIVVQLVRLGRAGRNVLGPENRRQRQILSGQLRFEAWIPSSVRRGSGSVPIVHLLVLVTNAIRYGAAAECQLRAEQVLAVTEHAPDQMPNLLGCRSDLLLDAVSERGASPLPYGARQSGMPLG